LQPIHYILNRYPTHPLLSITDAPANPHSERHQHLRQRSFIRIENDPKARVDGPDSLLDGRLCRPLPLDTHTRQEILSGCTRFSQYLIATIAVVTDCRGTHK